MAIPLWCSRAEIFNEFTSDERNAYFDLKRDSYLAEIDNFYYMVHLDEDMDNDMISMFVNDVATRAECFDYKTRERVDYYGFDLYPFGMKGYDYRLSMPECYDILIRKSLPNKQTPRIWVQIRSRFIWTEGVRSCIDKSFAAVCELLGNWEISVASVVENRVDYCHHTNAIQSPEKFFDRPKLRKHCKTTARIYNLVGNPQNDWSLDYCSIGSRNSKSLFFRIYNKCREVVELNYKGFFFPIWRERGLINEYDLFCLEYAYNLKSYDVGLLIGQLNWYLQYGRSDARKNEFRDLLNKYYAENSNSKKIRGAVYKPDGQLITYDDVAYIRSRISCVLPPVTVVLNIEFETHRDFYRSFEKSLLNLSANIELHNIVNSSDDMLRRVYAIYDCRQSFVDYLTSYGNFVSFVKDNKLTKKDCIDILSADLGILKKDVSDDMITNYIESQYLAFWRRLRQADWHTDYNPELYRAYARNLDIERIKRKLVSDVAVLSIYRNGENLNDLTDDMYDALGTLNDNDMHRLVFVDPYSGEAPRISYGDHYTVKQRKNRQYRTLLPSSDHDVDL